MIVEQHHERPDGRGFPYGLTASRFNQLAAIFIVCREFVELIHEANFDHSQHQRIVRSLQETYSGGHFDKAMDALLSIVSS
jgi:response regulator RpfG family c-di-GMP phosphodiesterase